MPNIFRALSSIAAWVLFIMGLLMLVFAFVFWFSTPLVPGEIEPWCAGDTAAVMGTVMLTLSVCVMTLRRKME